MPDTECSSECIPKSTKVTAGTEIRTVAKVTVKICGNLVMMEDLFNVRTATA